MITELKIVICDLINIHNPITLNKLTIESITLKDINLIWFFFLKN